MKKTFTTTMPDKVGAFVVASKIISDLGLNITRVSYNKAVDIHTLFIEASGDENLIEIASKKLEENGYLHTTLESGKVVLIEFKMVDKPGVLVPVLELINSYNFNISYISSQENGSEYQNFRMGLFVDSGKDISEFLKKASTLCELKIIDYDSTETVLDNTVFYINFASTIAKKLNLDDKQKSNLIVYSNMIMELCATTSRQNYKTFDYISRFADNMIEFKNNAFNPRITYVYKSGTDEIIEIEPPCGSNVLIYNSKEGTIVFDSGFARYKKETFSLINRLCTDFSNKPHALVLTHTDVDHVGLIDEISPVFMSQTSLENFVQEKEHHRDFREMNQLHAPYIKISKILASYVLPKMDNFIAFKPKEKTGEPLEKVDELNLFGFSFEVYEGAGGHVKGECVYVDRAHNVCISGDIFVNLKNLTEEQSKFNKLAPYLMTSVDTDSKLCKIERDYIPQILSKEKWIVLGGHGAPLELNLE